jgi:hypothetical protein
MLQQYVVASLSMLLREGTGRMAGVMTRARGGETEHCRAWQARKHAELPTVKSMAE